MSEQILNDTSAQLGYTVPFTSVHARKYRTADKSKTEITKTKDNPEKANNRKHSKTGSFASYDTQPGNEGGLILQCSRAHTGHVQNTAGG